MRFSSLRGAIALDDFGTGYSSLSYTCSACLKPAAKIKEMLFAHQLGPAATAASHERNRRAVAGTA